ncbi:hypothetical protein HMPREF0766_11591 [Sphingobacterium spiritivorum ATCC 33861]|uniref:Uncharacterized protein n=1 Tax=Sphingobacterium spiritivorum ATCC 33861 TaxID=525373 RepID=D7VKS2_SPHSI|nr:hypothetical protein HMPREF0766_11591 [Sphingobacterium spiritivorum ATCC 33861]
MATNTSSFKTEISKRDKPSEYFLTSGQAIAIRIFLQIRDFF